MILICPSCDTRYFTEASALGGSGRKVKCTSCGHSWFATPPEEGDIATAPPEAAGLSREQVERLRRNAAQSAAAGGPHAEFRMREMERRRRNRAMAAVLAWGGGLVLFGGAATAAAAFRDSVVSAWPRTATVYTALGLKVNRFGLDLANVTARRSFDGTTPVLTVAGKVQNRSGAARKAPLVRVSMRDEHGKEVGHWLDRLPRAEIPAAATVEFSTRIVSPPLETYALTLTFAAADAASAAERMSPPPGAAQPSSAEAVKVGIGGQEGHEAAGLRHEGDHAPTAAPAPAPSAAPAPQRGGGEHH